MNVNVEVPASADVGDASKSHSVMYSSVVPEPEVVVPHTLVLKVPVQLPAVPGSFPEGEPPERLSVAEGKAPEAIVILFGYDAIPETPVVE